MGAIGETGSNVGYYGLPGFAQSVGIELDLFHNNYAPYNDPPYPHMMLALNGSAKPVLRGSRVAIGVKIDAPFNVGAAVGHYLAHGEGGQGSLVG